MTEREKGRLSELGLLLVAFVWGAGFVVTKDTLSMLSPLIILSLRFIIASAMMGLLFFRRIGRIYKKDIRQGAIVGVTLLLGFVCQTYGLQYTTVTKQGFIIATYVVMVPFLFWLFTGKRVALRVILGSVLALIGILLITDLTQTGFSLGESLSLLAAFFFSLHILAIERFAREMNPFKLSFLQITLVGLVLGLVALVREPVLIAFPLRAWLGILYSAVFATLFCYTMQSVAQRYTSSSSAGLFLSLEAFFAAILGVVVLGETMTRNMIWGGMLIIMAVVCMELKPGVKRHGAGRRRISLLPSFLHIKH
jgi:drug/metabolite transporter (DMT)-like permease